MNSGCIMAVVVSFNGGRRTSRAIDALIQQVGHVHVVDNASNPESVDILEGLSREPNISVSWLEKNKGVGHALNIGIRMARKRGYRWLLTMDQDSIVDASMIAAYIGAVDRNSLMVCLTPQYITHDRGLEDGIRQVDYSITSGNLVRVDVYDKVGLYNEELFIDGVDFDFSLRVRNAGFKIHLVSAARMYHELGDKSCTIPVIQKIHTYHTPLRRYYIYRNYLYLVSEYARQYPGFIFRLTVVKAVYLLTTLILGEQRLKSIWYIVCGLLDYFRGAMGSYKYK